MMNKRNKVDLPEDLVVEILSRVPTIALMRLRSTSKAWNALVKDGRFSKKHSTNAPKQSLIIMLREFRVFLVSVDIRGMQDNNEVAPSRLKIISQFSLKHPLTNYSKEVDISNVYHCHGLLLCTTKDKNRIVVWNPVSGETKWIQPRNSYNKIDFVALGYDSKSSCYKIVRVGGFSGVLPGPENYDFTSKSWILDQEIYDFTSKSWIVDQEIYDFTSNSWSVVKVVGPTTYCFIPESRNRGLSVKGNTYWLGHSRRCGYPYTLLSFDFSTERFQTHGSFPFSLMNFDMALSVVREDQLCLLDVKPLDVDMASKMVISWSKILTTKAKNKFSPWMSYLADEQNKVLVCYDINKDRNKFLYIVAEDTYIQVNHHSTKSSLSSPSLLSYVPTLVQIQQVI